MATGGGVWVAAGANGNLRYTIAKQGGGPGEIRQLTSAGFGRGDSIWIVDGMFSAHAFAPPPKREYAASVHFKHAVTGGPTRFGFLSTAMIVGGRAEKGLRARPPSLTSWNGLQTVSFGVEKSGSARGLGPIFATDADHIWEANDSAYELKLLDTLGQTVKRIERVVDWFPAGLITTGSALTVKPRPQIVDVTADERSGLVLVLIRRANRNWKPVANEPTLPMRPAAIRRLATPDVVRQLFETVLDIFDARTGKLLASRELGGSILGFASPSALSEASEDKDGNVQLTIWRISLNRK